MLIVFTGGGDGSVVCFDSKTGDIKRVFRGPPQTAINSMQVSILRQRDVGGSHNDGILWKQYCLKFAWCMNEVCNNYGLC